MLGLFTPLDVVVAIILIAVLFMLVKVFAPKIKDVEEYYVASRSIPFSLLVGTLVATWYGGPGLLNTIEQAATAGLITWGVWCVGAHLARVPLALWLGPQITLRTEMTIPQMVKKSFGKNVAFFQGTFMLVGFISISEVVALTNVTVPLFGEGVSSWLIPVIVIAVVCIAAFGGMMGVAVTDMLLFWCMCTAVAIAVPNLFASVGGFEGTMAVLTERMGAEGAAKMFQPVAGNDVLNIITLTVMSLGVYVNAALYQRFSAADSPRSASRSYLTCFCIFIMLDLMLTLSGIFTGVLKTDPSQNTARLFVRLVIEACPPGVKALFAVGLYGAIISTLDSYWLVGGMTFANDVLGRFKKMTDAQNIFYGKVAMFVFAAVAYFSASFFQSTLVVTRFIGTMTMSTTTIMAFMGIFYKGRKTVFSGWATIIVGASIFWIFNFLIPINTPWGRLNAMLIALPVAILTFFISKNFGHTVEELEAAKA